MNAPYLSAINIGSLRTASNNNADHEKLLTEDGLSELMERDGWIEHTSDTIDPSEHHIVVVFGRRLQGKNFNDCHFFGVDKNGHIIEKNGKKGQASRPYDNAGNIHVRDVCTYFNKARAGSVMPPVFGGLWRMPPQGLQAHGRHMIKERFIAA